MDHIPDKNFYCRICGQKETNKKHNQQHHIIPRSLGGNDTDGRIILCEKCHHKIHNTIPVLLWGYIPKHKKKIVKELINQYTKKQVRF